MTYTMTQAFAKNFLGNSPDWYKLTIIIFLIINPFLFAVNPFLAGWVLVLQFIFTLAMALKCYPLQPGGLLAIEAIAIGMASPADVYHEAVKNFQVIALLMFMVAGIYFMKDMLIFTFTRILLGVRSKTLLSLLFCGVSAVLSAFLDALTVTAVIITVAGGFYMVYHKVASGKKFDHDHQDDDDDQVIELHREDLDRFRPFLRNLMMHAAVGTALGGATTQVGEPQNVIIAERAGWDFMQFFFAMAPVSLPVFAVGLVTCFILEKTHWFGYGAELPDNVRAVLTEFEKAESAKRDILDNASLIAQAVVAFILVLALGFHVAEVGIVGLMIIVLATSFTGVVQEHRLGKAFEEALPFTSLLVVFFAIVAVIEHQHLFAPVSAWVLSLEDSTQPVMFFLANGVLSMISDNVFVATVYISEIGEALNQGVLNREQFELLAIAINTGTNLPSVATPNGQAAFLFLLTSALAPRIRLSYGRMVWLALPYTIALTISGLLSVMYILPEFR